MCKCAIDTSTLDTVSWFDDVDKIVLKKNVDLCQWVARLAILISLEMMGGGTQNCRLSVAAVRGGPFLVILGPLRFDNP